MKWLCRWFGHKYDFRYETCLRCGEVFKKTSDEAVEQWLSTKDEDINIPVRVGTPNDWIDLAPTQEEMIDRVKEQFRAKKEGE